MMKLAKLDPYNDFTSWLEKTNFSSKRWQCYVIIALRKLVICQQNQVDTTDKKNDRVEKDVYYFFD